MSEMQVKLVDDQYRQLWEEIICSINVPILTSYAGPKDDVLFEGRCEWQNRFLKFMVGKIPEGHWKGKVSLMFTRFPERTFETLPYWDHLVVNEVMSQEQYDDTRSFGIEMVTMKEEVFSRLSKYNGVDCDLFEMSTRMEMSSLKDIVSKCPLDLK